MNLRTLGIVLLAVGIVLLVVAVVYWTVPAGHLPGIMGHADGSTRHHTKRALIATVLGIAGLFGGLLVYGRSRELPEIDD